jgi:hypothetical protein
VVPQYPVGLPSMLTGIPRWVDSITEPLIEPFRVGTTPFEKLKERLENKFLKPTEEE